MITSAYIIHSMKWVVPATYMIGTAPTYYLLWGSWRLVSSILPSRFFEAGDEYFYSLYQKFLLFFFENCSGVKITFHGDVEKIFKQNENAIIISNHQSTVDWLLASSLGARQGSTGRIRYILKDGLKYLPLYGYYFRQHSCVYIKRGGKFNEKKMNKDLDCFVKNKTPYWMVLFPEGTRYNPSLPKAILRSQSFAQKNGLPTFSHLLTPRLKALEICINRLRSSTSAVYDLTVAYASSIDQNNKNSIRKEAPNLADLLQGNCKEILVHLTRIPIEEVPTDSNKLNTWVFDLFSKKDKMLSHFFNQEHPGNFKESKISIPLNLNKTLPSFILFTSLNSLFFLLPDKRSFYCKTAILATLTGWIWVTIKS